MSAAPDTLAPVGRCGARTRAGRRCRLHGGAPGSGAQPGNANARKHGFYTKQAIAERWRLGALLRVMEASL